MGGSLVGREQEVAAALGSLALLAAGTGALAIEGEAGIGKSVLWELVVAAARERELRVLEARPSEAERSLSYAALGDLLRPGLDVLQGLPGTAAARARGRAAGRRSRTAAGLTSARSPSPRWRRCGSWSAEQPLALAIDDVQWLDADSARALTFALRRLGGEPLLALLARRGDRPAGLPLGLEAWDDARVLRLRLDPLGPTDMHTLLAIGSVCGSRGRCCCASTLPRRATRCTGSSWACPAPARGPTRPDGDAP